MGASNAFTLRPLILMQNKILRAMSYKPRCEPSAPLLRSSNFLNIYNINLYMCGLFTFKRLIAESEWFTTYRPYEYNTRLSNMSTLILPNLMTSHSRQSVRWVGASVWNGLPAELRDVSLSYSSFKRQLKKVLMNRQ